jgi:iron complex outermembrane receptor protein
MQNSFYVPSYTLVDSAIRYKYKGALFSLNANNVFDEEYVSTCFSDQSCYYGNRRSVIGTVTYTW